MAVGNPVNPGLVNQQLGQVVANLRNACTAARNFQNQITGLGTAGLVAGGFTSDDATAMVDAANYANTIAAVFFGTAAQTPAFDFDTELAGYVIGT